MAKGFEGLPGWAKGTIAVLVTAGGIIGVFYGVRAIRNQIKKSQGGTDKGQTSEIKETEDELSVLNKDTKTRQKLSNSQALAIANTIDDSMQGIGTDEQTIKDQFYKLSNDADFLAVQKAFGKRLIKSGSVVFVEDIRLTLIPALHNELSDYWINLINGILRKKNIKYRI